MRSTPDSGGAVRHGAALVLALAMASGAGAAEPVGEFAYGPHWRNTLDLYVPDGQQGPFPVVVYIHGGGWLTGDKSDAQQYVDSLLDRGIAVAGINYRYSQNATFPAQIHDCKSAVRWLRAHASQYNLNPERIAAFGESAGGHLASLLGVTAHNNSLEGSVGGNLQHSSEVSTFVDAYGPSDLFALAAEGGSMSTESQLIGKSVPQIYANINNPSWASWVALVRAASPTWHASPDDPPSLILHGTEDAVVPYSQSQIFYDALIEEGAPASLHPMPGAHHELTDHETQMVYDFLAERLAGPAPGLIDSFTGVGAGDAFGQSVAIIRDVNNDGHDDLLVGAPFNDDRGSSAGRAYLISGQTGAVIRSLFGRTAGDQFGYSVASAGDVNGDGRHDLLVGAPGFNSHGADSGRVYLFSGGNGAVLRVFDGLNAGDRLGRSVSGGGDVDGDGTADVLAGAPFADPHGSASGMAIVFSGSTGARLLRVNGSRAGDKLGTSVAVAGDMNGDGRAEVIIGAPYYDTANANAGRVLVYGKSGSTWAVRHAKSGVSAGETLGMAVAALGDINGDHRPDFAAGAPGHDSGAANSGIVRVYSGSSGGSLNTILPPSAQSNQRFGFVLAGVGDVTGDGRDDLAVGAGSYRLAGDDLGRVVVCSGADGSDFRTVVGEQANSKFGTVLAGRGDIDDDGSPDLVVGTPILQVGGASRGGCSVFSIQDLP